MKKGKLGTLSAAEYREILPDFTAMKDHDKALFDQLLPLYEKKGFDELLAKLTPRESNSQRLLVKMEVRRLMSPCGKPVDLRGKVAGNCRAYFLHNANHWMDDVAINLYHRRVDIYQGQMTLGLYEELHNTPNSYRVLRRGGNEVKASESLDTLDAIPLRFGHYLSRSENRIQLCSRIQAFLPDGTEVNGSTIDLSNSGMQVKLPASFHYEVGMPLIVYFPQLGDECQLPDLFSGLEYRVVGMELNVTGEPFQRLRLRLMSSSDIIRDAIEIKQEQGNSTRIENQDKFLTTRSRAYEHVFLEQTASLPLFFCNGELKYGLLTEQNRALWDYWQDERNLPVIDKLFTPKRLQYLALDGLTSGETLVYCFNHQHGGKTFFFSATPTELTASKRHLFWHVGSSRPTWRVLRITMAKINEEDTRRLQEAAPAHIEPFEQLTHIATVQDLTLDSANRDFRLPIKPKTPAKELNRFVHPRDPLSGVEGVSSNLLPQRREPRYQHRTRTTLMHPEEGVFEGETVDFSSQGLNLILDAPFTGSKLQQVFVTFDDLRRLDPGSPLHQVPYEVVQLSEDRTNIRLVLVKDRNSEVRSGYLKRLIDHNQHKLMMDSEKMPPAPLLHAMHQMLLTRLSATPYFVTRRGETLQVSAIGANYPGDELSRLLHKSAGAGMMSLAPILGSHLSKYATPVTRQRNRLSQVRHEFYVAATFTNGTVVDITSRPLESFTNAEERKLFITQARQRGKFFAVRNWLQPLEDGAQWLPAKMMDPLIALSTHRARQLEMEFGDLCAFGEMSDITDEVLRRLELG